jgi:hypothetical protein
MNHGDALFGWRLVAGGWRRAAGGGRLAAVPRVTV